MAPIAEIQQETNKRLAMLVQLDLLTTHLLANRHRLHARTIVDCLSLARFNPSPDRRYQAEELFPVLDTFDRATISQKLASLRKAGLIRYCKGSTATPGYCFSRIGPEENGVQP
jgi:hypothetical protein